MEEPADTPESTAPVAANEVADGSVTRPSGLRTLLFGGPFPASPQVDVGLLILRVVFGLALILAHGWPKFANLVSSDPSFADPLGIGPVPSLFLAGVAEAVFAALVVLGVLTRVTVLPVLVTMFVALFVVHGADPFAQQEKAALFGTAFLVLLITGPGRLSVDRVLWGRSGGSR
jgi:putative oxidoreductase